MGKIKTPELPIHQYTVRHHLRTILNALHTFRGLRSIFNVAIIRMIQCQIMPITPLLAAVVPRRRPTLRSGRSRQALFVNDLPQHNLQSSQLRIRSCQLRACITIHSGPAKHPRNVLRELPKLRAAHNMLRSRSYRVLNPRTSAVKQRMFDKMPIQSTASRI